MFAMLPRASQRQLPLTAWRDVAATLAPVKADVPFPRFRDGLLICT
jgi:hypothetical protein